MMVQHGSKFKEISAEDDLRRVFDDLRVGPTEAGSLLRDLPRCNNASPQVASVQPSVVPAGTWQDLLECHVRRIAPQLALLFKIGEGEDRTLRLARILETMGVVPCAFSTAVSSATACEEQLRAVLSRLVSLAHLQSRQPGERPDGGNGAEDLVFAGLPWEFPPRASLAENTVPPALLEDIRGFPGEEESEAGSSTADLMLAYDRYIFPTSIEQAIESGRETRIAAEARGTFASPRLPTLADLEILTCEEEDLAMSKCTGIEKS